MDGATQGGDEDEAYFLTCIGNGLDSLFEVATQLETLQETFPCEVGIAEVVFLVDVVVGLGVPD